MHVTLRIDDAIVDSGGPLVCKRLKCVISRLATTGHREWKVQQPQAALTQVLPFLPWIKGKMKEYEQDI